VLDNSTTKIHIGKGLTLFPFQGSLLYLCASRPDIMLSVCMCARYQSDPKECHLVAVKRILRFFSCYALLWDLVSKGVYL
jgi:hypothetical protein